MSWCSTDDGVYEFRCNGTDCKKTKTTRTRSSLPKGWFVTGVMMARSDPEFEDEERVDSERAALDRIGRLIGAHFCGLKCAKKTLLTDKVKMMVRRAGVGLALYGKCELVLDATGQGISVGRHVDADGDPEDPNPPIKLPEGGSPI